MLATQKMLLTDGLEKKAADNVPNSDGCVRKFERSKPLEKFFTRSTVLSTHINL